MPRSYINAVYYPNWRVYKDLPPSSLQVQCITHIYYAFLGVTEGGHIKHFDEWADINMDVDGVKGCIAAVNQLKRTNPGLKTIVTFGGGEGSGPFPAMAASPHARHTFAAQVRRFVDHHGFDGADIDWEHPSTPAQGQDYLALMHALRAALPAPRYVLATALPCGKWALCNVPLEPLAPLIDYLNLMSYDFSGPWTPAAGHQAQLYPPPPQHHLLGPGGGGGGGAPPLPPPLPLPPFRLASAQSGLAYLLQGGVHPSKVALGVPAYARCFRGARGPGDCYTAATEVDYCELPVARGDDGHDHVVRVDSDVCAAYYVDEGEGGLGFVSLDTPATVRLKARYARGNRLAGLFYWQGAGDVSTPGRSLVAAGYQELMATYAD